MTWLIIILVSLIIMTVFLKFYEKLINIIGLMSGLMLLGLVIIPFNMKLGTVLSASMFFILLLAAITLAFSSIISAFVATPLWIIWTSIKSLFK
jgi:hypothetical protein